jgi:hypothetical protein
MQNIILTLLKSLAYPPTEDQLKIIGVFFNNLWVLRFFSLVFLFLALFFWYKLLAKWVNKSISLISCLIIFLSPAFYVLWLSYPLDCLKIFLLLILIYLLSKIKINFYKLVLVLGTLYIIFFSFLTTTERSSFVHKIGLKDATKEVQERFAAEDSVINPVKVPLNVKRIVYNKYFVEYKQLINEVIPFFDMESIFFQEIHPLEQKSVVIFVWPQIFLLVGGVYFLVKYKNNKINLLVVTMLFLSLISFLFDPNAIFRKFSLILLPLSLVMSIAVFNIFKTKILFGKIFGFIIIFFSLYGISANHFDLNKRPDYWLDNRPYFYEFVFESIKKRDLNDFKKVYITTLVGNTERYCKFYLETCNSDKFIFNSFELEGVRPEKKSIYAGFAGEFVGSDFKNNINNDWLTLINDKGFTGIETKEIRDTIAYKFGSNMVIGEAK